MWLKYGIANLLIVTIIILLASITYRTWTEPVDLLLGIGAVRHPSPRVEIPAVMPEKKEPSDISAYKIISEKNIFSPQRKDFPVQTGTGMNKPAVRPQIVLNGVTIASDYQSASVINPGRALRKGERETLTLRTGDRIGEYKLAKILPDRIVLEATEDSFEVLLQDPDNPKKRIYARTETKPATTTSTVPASPVASAVPSASPVATSPQQATTRGEPEVQKAIQPKVARTPPATPYPIPTLRSRSAPTSASTPRSPATPIAPPEASTGSSVGSLIGSQGTK